MDKIQNKSHAKLNKLIDKFDVGFADIKFKPNIENVLHGYQVFHVINLINILSNNASCAIDFSSTGMGKTYTSIALCAQQNLLPIIICTKSVIYYWQNVCALFNVQCQLIVNYESIKNCNDLKYNIIKYDKIKNKYIWENIDKTKNIIIFDEAHKCKNLKSLNGKLLLSTKNICRVLLLSATIAQKIDDFLIFGYMINLYDTFRKGKKMLISMTKEDQFKLSKESQIIKHLYPCKGSRMSKSQTDNKILNNVYIECYSLDKKNNDIIEKEYTKYTSSHTLAQHMKSREIIEEIKLPIFIELIEKYIEVNKYVVVFVNFRKSLMSLYTHFLKQHEKCSIVHGDQTADERHNNIDDFQNNKTNLILCMIQSGSESISLHDLDGLHPRISLISPSFSGVELCQALGRSYRNGTKSNVEQHIIFCDQETEINMCNALKKKLGFINNFLDYDKFDAANFNIGNADNISS